MDEDYLKKKMDNTFYTPSFGRSKALEFLSISILQNKSDDKKVKKKKIETKQGERMEGRKKERK